ncbi:hypothetical protein I3760_03G059100 [Carya illinoinensis]|nr:hypothetical protein I3760_03G059100 [Carya illinoinensis]
MPLSRNPPPKRPPCVAFLSGASPAKWVQLPPPIVSSSLSVSRRESPSPANGLVRIPAEERPSPHLDPDSLPEPSTPYELASSSLVSAPLHTNPRPTPRVSKPHS